jgi:hypothetical protein
MKRFVFLLFAALLFCDCGALFLGSSQIANLNTTPDGATILINGSVRGQTPLKLKLRTNESYIITFKKDGYEDQTYSITNHVSGGIVVLDVLFGILPVVVDAATGSWYRLDDANINLPLEVKKLSGSTGQ